MIAKEAMQAQRVRKQNQEDVLLDELFRERAAVLARAGFAVEDALDKLRKIEQRIEKQLDQLRAMRSDGHVKGKQGDERLIFNDVNAVIDEYNEVCRKADLQYYYLIVTREAMGLRRHETVKQFYTIPPKKKKLQAV
jgi:hypothetical protein